MSNGTATTSVGAVVSLRRYPVKSMMGEELNPADITQRGLLGDRVFALMDVSDGKVVSAKNPRKWPRLFECGALFVEPPVSDEAASVVRITLPDGTSVTSRQGDVDQVVSAALGRPVKLESVPPQQPSLEEYWPDIDDLDHRDTVTDEAISAGTFFDGAPIHILTTATLDRLRQSYAEGRFEVRRFRPNIVVKPSSDMAEFIENEWVGRTIALGDRVRLSITGRCPRCVMTTLAQADLPSDPGILRTAAKENQAHVGVYATVLRGGTVQCGDPVTLDG